MCCLTRLLVCTVRRALLSEIPDLEVSRTGRPFVSYMLRERQEGLVPACAGLLSLALVAPPDTMQAMFPLAVALFELASLRNVMEAPSARLLELGESMIALSARAKQMLQLCRALTATGTVTDSAHARTHVGEVMYCLGFRLINILSVLHHCL